MRFGVSTFTVLSALSLLFVGFAGCEREEETAPPPAETTATEPAEPAQATVDTETKVRFDTLVKQVTEHIRKGELQAAETGLRELEKMSTNLPEDMRQQIATVRAALAAARAGSTGTPPAAQTPAPQAPAPQAPAQ